MKKYLFLSLIISLFLVGCDTNQTENDSNTKIKKDIEISENLSISNSETIIDNEPVLEEFNDSNVIETKIDNNEESLTIQETEEIVEDEIDKENIVLENSYENITLGFVGDVYLGDKLYSHYNNENNVLGFMSEKVLSNFQNVDIMVANHEYVSTDLPDSSRDTRQLYNFKAPTNREYIWNELGVDVLSLANNHAMDYGEQSLFDTIETLDSLNLAHIGAGKDLEDAKKSYIKEINGKKIAILATCRFIVDGEWYATEDTSGVLTTYDTTPYFEIVKDEIKRLKDEEKCDFVIVYVHFGTEKSNKPNSNQPLIAYGYIDSGADCVIGSHAHTLQGIEFYNGKPIYYNLGNFLFSSYDVDTMVVNISINEDNTCNTSILPCMAGNFKVTDATGDNYVRILDYIESISINAYIDENGNVFEKEE